MARSMVSLGQETARAASVASRLERTVGQRGHYAVTVDADPSAAMNQIAGREDIVGQEVRRGRFLLAGRNFVTIGGDDQGILFGQAAEHD